MSTQSNASNKDLMDLKKELQDEIEKRKKLENELLRVKTRLIDVQEDVRKRLSRDLHDAFGQNLYSHLISINLLQSQIKHPLITQLQAEATELIEEVRRISWELRPSVLDDLGLIPAIRSYVTRYSSHYGIDVSFDYTLSRRLPANKEIAIYRIIQESLTNTRKYAKTKHAEVTVKETDYGTVRVVIEDDGIGFDPENIERGVGLFSMKERARSVGGEFCISSEAGKGTKIVFEVMIE